MSEVLILSKPRPGEFIEQWYDLATEDHFWIRWRIESFLKQILDLGIPTDQPLLGLDIGCGTGVVGRQLESKTRWTVDGADLNEKALSLCSGGRGRIMLYNIHDRKADMKERYDFLILFDVIEHIKETQPFLESAAYHLKPGGWLFFNVPALSRLFSDYDRAAGHVRRYEKSSLRAELIGLPAEVRDIRYWGASLLPMLVTRSMLPSRRTSADAVIKSGFQPPYEWINAAFKLLMKLEMSIVARPPIGASLLAAARMRD